MGVVGC